MSQGKASLTREERKAKASEAFGKVLSKTLSKLAEQNDGVAYISDASHSKFSSLRSFSKASPGKNRDPLKNSIVDPIDEKYSEIIKNFKDGRPNVPKISLGNSKSLKLFVTDPGPGK